MQQSFERELADLRRQALSETYLVRESAWKALLTLRHAVGWYEESVDSPNYKAIDIVIDEHMNADDDYRVKFNKELNQ